MNTDDMIKTTYNKVAGIYNENYGQIFTDNKYMDKFIEYLDGKNILDVGSGLGDYSNYLFNKGINPIGIDLSDCLLEISKRSYPEICFKQMDMRNLDFEDNSFSGILAAYSLIHIEEKDLQKVRDEFDRVLKPGGILLLIVHEGNGEKIIKNYLSSEDDMFVHYFTLNNILNLFNNYELLYTTKRKPKENESQNNKLYVYLRKSL